MILYHASKSVYDHVDVSKSKPTNDFGQGLYLTADYYDALAYMEDRGQNMFSIEVPDTLLLPNVAHPTLSKYHFGFHGTNFYGEEEYMGYQETLDFMRTVIANRKQKASWGKQWADIMTGPRADARVQVIIDRYIHDQNDYDDSSLVTDIFNMCNIDELLPQVVFSQAACELYVPNPVQWMF